MGDLLKNQRSSQIFSVCGAPDIDVPCWMLDTAYNGMVFHADRVFFTKTAAWDSLRKALRATHDDAGWAHLAGDTSAPFAAAVAGDIAVKVIDEQGNELPVIQRLAAAA